MFEEKDYLIINFIFGAGKTVFLWGGVRAVERLCVQLCSVWGCQVDEYLLCTQLLWQHLLSLRLPLLVYISSLVQCRENNIFQYRRLFVCK
jgi:hypothetical protein